MDSVPLHNAEKGFRPTLMILSYNDLSGVGGSFSLIKQEFEYFASRGPTLVFSRTSKDRLLRSSKSLFFPYLDLPTRPLRLLFSLLIILLKLVNCSRTIRVDAYHAHDVYVGSAAAIAARLFGIRLVLTVHGPACYEFANFYRKRWNEFKFNDVVYLTLLSAIEKFAYKRADAIVAVSDFERKFIERVRTTDLFVVRNGIDLNLFLPTSDKRKARLLTGLPIDKRIVTFVGRMVPKNGVLIVALAIAKVAEAIKNVIFLFVGDGFAENECKDIVNRVGASSKVIFIGRKTDPLPYYQASDLFVSHVSSLVEGVGLTVLEAIACGIPAVVGFDRISYELLNGVAHFVEKDSPSALAEQIIRVLDTQDLEVEKVRLREFAEGFLDINKTFEIYAKLLFEGDKA